MVFTIRNGDSWVDEDITFIEYVGKPSVEAEENLERALVNQLGVDLVRREDVPEPDGKIPLIRRTPYGENTVHPPKGEVYDPRYEDNAKVLVRGRISSEELPPLVYRGSPSDPSAKLEEGFIPRGNNRDLHVHTHHQEKDNAFVSTSTDFEVAAKFSRHGQDGYVYAIRPTADTPAYDVNRALPGGVVWE